MTRLVFLSPNEKRRFDSPPSLNKKERLAYFSITSDIRKTLSHLKTATNQVGFLLQLGYFKYSAKFFTADQFRAKDIHYVKRLLNITDDIDLSFYQKTRMRRHRLRILTLLGWTPLSESNAALITEHVQMLAIQQLKPRQIFIAIVDFCWKNKIEIPTHHQLSEIITDSYNQVESKLLDCLAVQLNSDQRTKLDQFITTLPNQLRPLLTEIKQINQSLRPIDIQKNIKSCQTLAEHFKSFQPLIDALNLTDHAAEYYAIWVQKAETAQLKQFPNPDKAYLHLLAYIKHQYFLRQDILTDIFLKSVRSAVNAADKRFDTTEKNTRKERRKAIKAVTKAHKASRLLLNQITVVVKAPNQTAHEKIVKIERLIDDHDARQTERESLKLARFEKALEYEAGGQADYAALEHQSLSLQRKVSSVLKTLVFNPASSNADLLEAIDHFNETEGSISHSPPSNFLSEKEKEHVGGGAKFRISLYKILLFKYCAEAIRAGKLNLKYSYRYRAIQDYLIALPQWKHERENLLRLAGLTQFSDGKNYLIGLKRKLEAKYQSVNERYLADDNPYLTIDEFGTTKVRTPGTDFIEEQYIASVLTENGIVPILQILRDIHQASDFVTCFKHLSVKHSKLKPSVETILAGIMGNGCNIGINKLAQISVGINENTLRNTVTWCFSLENIQCANNKILHVIDKLALANAFKKYPNELHTSSDGRKVNVAVDSLHANYSFKYFGKDKGVTLYTFIDERHSLFHVTVISASDREAAFVIDGLLQNDVVKSDIHSTDTHGFTESIFAATHLIDTAFAPRFKKIGDQTIYGFSNPSTYRKRGYAIAPSRTINQKLILKHWDDILRFMATIKLKYSSASLLFKRLSSYAKDHPLYQALKEFGRIIKSQFILTYYDEIELRQRIEKQLNKIELANRFSKAVFFANNQEFQEGSKEAQEIATACKVLIQNAIILWNYLYLSEVLSNITDPAQKDAMLVTMTNGSILTWRHVNLQGEYDFTRPAANDHQFDLNKILALKLA